MTAAVSRSQPVKARPRDFSEMSPETLKAFCAALNAVARKAAEKEANKRRCQP
jgi:hypothetical protein